MGAYKEEIISTNKINFSTRGKTFKYLSKKWYLIILLILLMSITSFYDASFVPSMNRALINVFDTNFYPSLPSVIWGLTLTLSLFGINISLSFEWYIITYVIMVLIRSITIFFSFYLMNYFEMTIMTSLRKDAFKKIQELSFSYFDKTSSGWLVARLQNDAASIGDVLTNGVLRIFWVLMDLLFTLITMFTISWQLSLIILASTPVIAFIVFFFEKRILKNHRIARNAYSYFVGWLAECISGSKTIKTLSIEETIYKECEDINRDVRVKRYKAGKVGALFQPSISWLAALTNAIIIIVFVNIGSSNALIFNTATLVLFIGFVGQIYNPIQELAEIFSELMATQASVEKLFSLIDAKPELQDSKEVIEKYGDLFHNKYSAFPILKGDIYFKDVSFSYNKGIEVLHSLNLHLKEGSTCAIVGETGSGKSTTVNLLCRFYEPTKGQILIDGIDYKKRSVGWLRSNIGYVQQTPFIFKGTINDNVRYGKLNATEEEIIRACKIIDIDDFIQTLPNGYNTYLYDGGNELSQGQKQLLAFARAIVRDPRILILDEATSSIDTETEEKIQTAIKSTLKGRTSLIIAHRLSTVVDCDRIIVMRDGLIVEDGNHVSLMNKKGYYHELYMNQFKELDVSSQLETFQNQITDKGIKL